ncbi:hypothetical protein [Halosimplex marinum]|uniref:hypothetical protein n=1 Tax=Halosimplex marinum TaxID=3396620 RepID=UPI003F543A4D
MERVVYNCELVDVRPDHTFDGQRANPYRAISDSDQDTIIRRLKREFGENEVNSVLSQIWDWKRTSYANHAKSHEVFYDSAFEIDAPPRNGDLVAVEPWGSQQEIIERLYELTQAFLDRNFGDSVPVYRGLKHLVPEVITDILERPGRTKVTTSFSCLCNFTVDPIIAKRYGSLVIQLDLRPEDILLAPDFILKHREDGEIVHRDAEVQVRGDTLPEISIGNFLLPESMEPIAHKLINPKKASKSEHHEICMVLSVLDERGTKITERDSMDRLWEWFDAYQSELTMHEHYLLNKAESHLTSLSAVQ